jgi:hypothetical protein
LESEDRTPGWHVSDVLDPRLGYFKRLTKSGIPDRLLNVFMVGKVAHGIIELIHNEGEGGIHTSDAGTREIDGISYSPDAFASDESPIEIKTTRSFYLPKQAYLPDDQTYHMYLEQLLAYMALENKVIGRLTILYLNLKDEEGKTAPQFYVWKVETSPEALTAYRSVVFKVKRSLDEATEKKSAEGLPLCRAWKCKDCDFWDLCRPQGRYEHGRDSKGQKLWS